MNNEWGSQNVEMVYSIAYAIIINFNFFSYIKLSVIYLIKSLNIFWFVKICTHSNVFF